MSNYQERNQAHNQIPSRRIPEFELRGLRDYYQMIRERWYIGFFLALIVVSISGYFLLNRPPVYEARASLLVDRGTERVVDMHQVVDTGLDGSGNIWMVLLQNHIRQMSSRTFHEYLVESFTEEERERIVAPYISDDESEPPPSVEALTAEIHVENPGESFILQVHARHRNPEVAVLIADRYVERYIEFVGSRRHQGNEAAIGFLSEQAEKLRQKVDESEQALQRYRQEHNLVSVEENQNVIVERLMAINQNLTNARVERIDLAGRLRQVERYLEEDKNLLELDDVSSLGYTREIANELGRLRQEQEVLSEKYLERHPRMIANRREIQAVENRIRDNIELTVAELRNRLQSAKEKEEALFTEMGQAERESLELDRMAIEYSVLQRAAEGARRTHAQLLDRLNETRITSQLQDSNIRTFDRAAAPGSPVEPDRLQIALLLVFLGGFVSTGVPLGLGLIDRRFKASSDVEEFLGQRLVGEVSAVRGVKKKERAHVVEKELDDHAAEAFRGVITQLQLNTRNSFPRVMMATSTIPGEGKSFLVSNLGSCCAAHGMRTLLVDLDLRRPALDRMYKRPHDLGVLPWLREGGALGGDLLSREALGIAEVAQNLSLLCAGGFTKRATETLNRPEIPSLIEALKLDFDVIVIDTPPVGVFADALSIGRLTEGAFYVVRFGKVDREQVQGSLGRLEASETPLLGVVMNGMPRARRYSHYYSGYGYGNYKYSKYYAGRK